MQAESNKDDLSLPRNLLKTIPAETLQTIWKYDTWMKSIVRDIRKVQNPPQGDKNIELAPLPSRSALFSSVRPPSDVSQVSVENTGADLSGDSHEPHGAAETDSQEQARVSGEIEDLPDQRLRISPTEVMLSLAKLRLEYQWIKPLSTGSPIQASTSTIERAQILNNLVFVGAVQAVKKFKFGEDERVLGPFAYELWLLSELNHENVIKLVGFVESAPEKIAWLVLPWMKNGNVREFVRSKTWEIPECVSLMYDVACGVEYLHNRTTPIIHGDLKSLNILVNADNRALITDFGSARAGNRMSSRSTGTGHERPPSTEELSRETEEHQSSLSRNTATSPSLTLTGPAWTLRWAAPELLSGDHPSFATDIWAFGWICWEIITGTFPFEDLSAPDVIKAIVTGELPQFQDNSKFSRCVGLWNLISSCWTFDPKKRPSARDFKTALSWMPRIIPNGEEAQSPELLRVLGDTYVSGCHISEGLECIERALQIAYKNRDSAEIGFALLSLGHVHYIRCEYGKAEKAFREAKELHAGKENHLGVAQSLCGLAQVHCLLGKYDSAESSFIAASKIYIGTQHDTGFADTLYGLAELSKRRGKLSKAESLYTQARDAYMGVRNQLGVAAATCGMADIDRMMCKHDRAESAYRSAADLYNQLGNTLGVARVKCGLGDIYCQKGTHNQAEELYGEAREIFLGAGHPLGLAYAHWGLGRVYRSQGRDSESYGCFDRAEQIHTQIGDQLGVAQNHCAKGDWHRSNDEYFNAETAYSKGRELYELVGHHLGAADAMCGLGHVRRVLGKDVEAEELFNQARGIYNQEKYDIGAASAALGLASIYIERLEYEDASSTIKMALELAMIPSLKASALMLLSLLYELQEQSDKSVLYIKEAIDIYSEINDESGVLVCRELLDGIRDTSGTSTGSGD